MYILWSDKALESDFSVSTNCRRNICVAVVVVFVMFDGSTTAGLYMQTLQSSRKYRFVCRCICLFVFYVV